MREPLPLATIQDAVLEFLRGREDAVLFGAQAVNAYTQESRMTQEVDILSTRTKELAKEIGRYLNDRIHIATGVREVCGGIGYRVYQLQKPENRHLVDVRPVVSFPPTQRIEGVMVVSPAELIANKVLALRHRRNPLKAFTDQRDAAGLLLQFPDLKSESGPVHDRLVAAGADETEMGAWREVVAQEILPEEDEDEFR